MPRFGKFVLERWVRSTTWLYGFLIALCLALIAYLLNMVAGEVSPGNAWGLTYGTIAAVLMIGAAFYGGRRRMHKYHLGKSHHWVQFHVYGGTLFMLFVFMHSGFRIPTGMLTWWLWFFSLWITVSGLIGVGLQKWIPRMLSSGLAIEAVYERIPELVRELRARAEQMIETCTEPVQVFYRRSISPVLMTPQTRLIYYVDITGGIQSRMRQFDYLRRVLSADEKETLDTLEDVYKTKLELDAHYTLQKALRWWLYAHVPIAFALIVLLGFHLYSVFYY